MKILQLVPDLIYGDGVGNDVVAIDKFLKNKGIETFIYCINCDERLGDIAKSINNIPHLGKEDIVLYHFAVGSIITELIKKMDCCKVLVYHNITPSEFYEPYNVGAVEACKEGERQVLELKKYIDYCLADSAYNKEQLIKIGYECKIDVLPILMRFDDYEKDPDAAVIEKYGDKKKNIIFTGRIAPNKKQEDVIKAFYYYKKYWNSQSRLILVGGYNEEDLYYKKLKKYVERLKVEDVVFTGHISFREILAFYYVADVFLCMSEHEGFCIPLVEAMKFEIPIIAYNSSAIGETLGKGGILLSKKDYLEIAGSVNRMLIDNEVKEKMLDEQKKQMYLFSQEKWEQIFENTIKSLGI